MYRQNNLFKITRSAGILLLFLCVSLLGQAQQTPEEDVPDTTVTVTPIEAPPPLLDTIVGDTDIVEDEEDTSLFIPTERQLNDGGPDSLQLRKVSAAQMKKLQEDDAFWYANAIIKKKKEQPRRRGSFLDSNLFEGLLWLVIIVVFIAVLVMYLSNSNVRLFRKNRSIAAVETDIETEDIFAINYRKEIDKAVGENNYRLAVRLQFLQLLRKLAERNIINYKQDHTNFDYLMQMSTSSWYNDFSRLTRSYEYSWYGQFDIDQSKYNVIKNDFENFDNKLR